MALDAVFRDQWGRVFAALTGFLGDIELAEDAARRHSRSPRNAGRAIDHIRRQRTLAEKTRLLARELAEPPEEPMDETTTFRDERLELIFTCCYPALALDAQVALTLRTSAACQPRRSPGPSSSRSRR